MPKTIKWADVEPIAVEAFRIFTGSPELGWAKQAWSHLTKMGLAKDGGELDRLRAFIRFLVLASIYRDWCAVAWDYDEDDEPTLWLSNVEIDPLHLGQLLGPDVDVEVPRPFDARLDKALNILMEREREAVVAALLSGFGSVADLFLALWRSNRPPTPPTGQNDDDEDPLAEPPETDFEVLNNLTVAKLAAYHWIDEGCEFRGPARGRTD